MVKQIDKANMWNLQVILFLLLLYHVSGVINVSGVTHMSVVLQLCQWCNESNSIKQRKHFFQVKENSGNRYYWPKLHILHNLQ